MSEVNVPITHPPTTVLGLTWRQSGLASEGTPIWDLVLPAEIGLRLCLKDYGRFADGPDSPFSGIRLVGGGPFSGAGHYASIPEAMEGVASFVREMLSDKLDRERAKAAALTAAIEEVEKFL